MCDIPVEVADEETVVRALRQVHLKKGKLRNSVFLARGVDEVSVMRHTYMKSDACKAKAKEIFGESQSNPYVGLAAITVGNVRQCGSEVTDSRDEFCGHAHISHGFVVPADEPPDPEFKIRMQALTEKAVLLVDLEPGAKEWRGPQVEIRAPAPDTPPPQIP